MQMETMHLILNEQNYIGYAIWAWPSLLPNGMLTNANQAVWSERPLLAYTLFF